MKRNLLIALIAGLALSTNALAEGGYALAQKHMCTSCHSLDRKVIGPPWMSISQMYQNRPDAEAYLAGKIRTGGTGTWGTAHMLPSSATVGDDDIKALANYIMSLAKQK